MKHSTLILTLGIILIIIPILGLPHAIAGIIRFVIAALLIFEAFLIRAENKDSFISREYIARIFRILSQKNIKITSSEQKSEPVKTPTPETAATNDAAPVVKPAPERVNLIQ